MGFFYSIISFFSTGGVFMYPILIVFAVGLAIASERYITLAIVTKKNQVVWDQVQPVLAEGDFEKAREMTSEDESTISQVLNMGLSLQGAVRRREDIEIAMEESMMEIVPRLEKRTPYVALASSVATLLGLLGTIMGLIQAFTAVANANPAEKADLSVRQYFGRDEHHGIWPDGGHSVADHSRDPDEQNRRHCRQPRDGDREGAECVLTPREASCH